MNTLTWNSIRAIGSTDNGNRWHPVPDVAEYFSAIRSPSRAWPHSYAKAAQTQKFARWLIINRPALAKQLGVSA